MTEQSPKAVVDKRNANIYSDGTYLQNNQSWHVEDSPWKAVQIYSILQKNSIACDNVAEIGCGAGEILRQLSLKLPQSNFTGFELSPQAFKLCQSRASKNIRFVFEDILSQDSVFDVALCIDVFEHVDDYMGFIRGIQSKAKYKIFHIPLDISVLSVLRNSLVTERNNVGHLHYFCKETALATLADCGYKVIDYSYTRAFDELPCQSLKAKLLLLPRLILFKIAPDFMVKVLGGCSLIVLAE
jgi:hypothetical protein